MAHANKIPILEGAICGLDLALVRTVGNILLQCSKIGFFPLGTCL